ncbi:MAG: hypothetical protein ABH871_08175 [Pseudomonadota bacterium]
MIGALAVIVGLGLLALGCDDEFSSGNEDAGTGGTGGTAGTGGTGATSGSGGAGGAGGTGGAGGIPEHDGFNDNYYTCSYSGDCKVLDLDINQNKMHLMTGYPTNRKGLINIDSNDAMTSASASFGTGDQYFIGEHVDGLGHIHPVQVTELQNSFFLVPFEEDQAFMSGIALIDDNGASKKWLLQQIKYAQVEPILEIDLSKIQAGVIKEVDGDDRLFLIASNKVTDSGLVLSYGIKLDGSLDQNDLKLPIYTSGQKPCAVESLSTNEIAVLNSEGANGASIDIINTEQQNPAQAVVATISLGQNVKVVPLYELALTADKNYAVVAGGTGSQLTTIYIVDMVNRQVAGSIDISQYADEVRGIEIKDDKAYISTDNSAGIDKVFIVDFSSPSSPTLAQTIDVGYDLGAIAVHESGVVFVAATDRWYEAEGTASERWTHMVAFDPALVDVTDGGT